MTLAVLQARRQGGLRGSIEPPCFGRGYVTVNCVNALIRI